MEQHRAFATEQSGSVHENALFFCCCVVSFLFRFFVFALFHIKERDGY